MSAARRVQQWLTLSPNWWLFDAKWQDPYESAKVLKKYLLGLNKPIYTPTQRGDFGDHVVVINSKEIALKGDEWWWRVYFHHSGYPGSASWTKAWEVHKKDPTLIMSRAVYGSLSGKVNRFIRRHAMERLHVYEDESLPEMIRENLTDQIRPLRPLPTRLDKIGEEEKINFPKLFDYPPDYVHPTSPAPPLIYPNLKPENKGNGRRKRKR